VTAQRRSELSRDVPISITSLSEDVLQQSGAQQLGDIAKTDPRAALRCLRLLRPADPFAVWALLWRPRAADPMSGIYVDGFFSSNSEVSDFQLMKCRASRFSKDRRGRCSAAIPPVARYWSRQLIPAPAQRRAQSQLWAASMP